MYPDIILSILVLIVSNWILYKNIPNKKIN